MPDSLKALIESEEPERLATGFEFTEGPLWHPDGYWLFVDLRRSPDPSPPARWRCRDVPGGQRYVQRADPSTCSGA